MRDAFINSLCFLAENDKDITLLTADLGFGVFEDFEKRFPNQYFNTGVAEQNMTGVATGLALEGKKVITYSIGNFPILRCLEQIRNDACYHKVNITIVGSGGGFSYGALGMSHHATEDLSILRSLPNINVIAPSTAKEAGEATVALIKNKGVGYLRLDKTSAADLDDDSQPFIIGGSRIYRNGNDITLITTGGILKDVIDAAIKLNKNGINARVVGLHSLKPIDKNQILDAASKTGGIITIEEHNKDGGLGSAVAEVCMDNEAFPRIFLRIALNDSYSSIVGSQQYLKMRYKMDASSIYNQVLARLQEI